MDVDLVTKKPRMSDERSINKGKSTVVEVESHDQSQSVSNTKRTITNPTMEESTQDPTMIFQKSTLDEAENSQVFSQEELVKDFTNE